MEDAARRDAALLLIRLVRFDGTSADDILQSAVNYLVRHGVYEAERERYGSSLELIGPWN